MNVHGDAHTHLDALCHVVYDGVLYNGIPASTLTPSGATALSVEAAADGIVGRGVLLDIPAARDVPWLEPGEHVTLEDLERAEGRQDVAVGRGTSSAYGWGTVGAGTRSAPGTWRTTAPACIRRPSASWRSAGSRSSAATATTTRPPAR